MSRKAQLTKVFWDTVLESVKKEFDGNQLEAARHLGIDKNRINAAKVAQIRKMRYAAPNAEKVLKPCMSNGSDAIHAAASDLYDHLRANGKEAPPQKFKFLYAGMQLILADQFGLLRAAIAGKAYDELERQAIADVVAAWCRGNLFWAYSRLSGQSMEPYPLEEIQTCHGNCFLTIADTLLTLAVNDDIGLIRQIQRLDGFNLASRNSVLTEADCARAMFQGYRDLHPSHMACRALMEDAMAAPELKRRPFYRVVSEVFRVLDGKDYALRQDIHEAIALLKRIDRTEAAARVGQINDIAKCVSGNKSLYWIGEREIVTLDNNGVRLEPLPRDSYFVPRPGKIEDKQAMFLDIGPILHDGSSVLVVDDEIYDVFELSDEAKGELGVELAISHKLNR